MKVKCKISNLNDVSDADILARLKKYISRVDGEVGLDIGREYVVYGIVFWDNCPWYYICPEDYDEYPQPYSAEFFDVIDDKLSSYWKLASFAQGNAESATMLVFSEWAENSSFYEGLVDGEAHEVSLFSTYRKLIDQEVGP